MYKKRVILSTLLLFAIVLPCFLSISPINLSNKIDSEQYDTKLNILATPKSSGYAVTERWNDTTGQTINDVAVSADGNYMAIVTQSDAGHELFFYNTSNHDGIPMWSYEAGTDIDSVAISKDGTYIVVGLEGHETAILFNRSLPTGAKKPVWEADIGENVQSVDISSDGSLIVVGTAFTVWVYNNSYASGISKTSKYLWREGMSNFVNSVAISYNGEYVVTGTNEGGGNDNVFFWNTTEDVYKQNNRAPEWSYDTGNDVESVDISANGDYVAAGGSWGGGPEFFLFNKSSEGTKTPQFKDDCWWIHSVAISADGEYIAVGEDNSGIAGIVSLYSRSQRLWENDTNGIVRSVDITADGRYIVAGTDYTLVPQCRNTVFLYNRSGNVIHPPEWNFNTSYTVNSVSISSWGNYIGAGGSYDVGGDLGISYLFYHARPPPTVIPLPTPDDDDDDDDDTGAMVVVVVIIILASVGGVVVVIIVLIKKGILDLSKLKR